MADESAPWQQDDALEEEEDIDETVTISMFDQPCYVPQLLSFILNMFYPGL